MDNTNSKKISLRNIILAVLSGIVAAFNLKVFVNAGNLTPGGISGMAILIERLSGRFLPFKLGYGLLYMLLNIPGVIVIYKTLGKRFTILSRIDIILTSTLVNVFPNMDITDDMLLIAVFGGLLTGISDALVLESGGCGGGTHFWAIYFSRKYQKSMWNAVLVLNAILLSLSGMVFNWEAALYSIIFQFVCTQVVDRYDNRYRRSTFIIITEKPEEITQSVFDVLHHSVTRFEGKGSYTHETKTVLYTVCGKYEEDILTRTIMEIDPKAFVNIMDSHKVVGNFRQKPF
ncbi:MAG: YitT family protein [Erysipelotrichaceae bacterium]|nr:YitT family protein [Erysipelotrichaceae bacterium]